MVLGIEPGTRIQPENMSQKGLYAFTQSLRVLVIGSPKEYGTLALDGG